MHSFYNMTLLLFHSLPLESGNLLWPVNICKCDVNRGFISTCTLGLALSLVAGNLSPQCKQVQASLLEGEIMSRETLAILAIPDIPAEAADM